MPLQIPAIESALLAAGASFQGPLYPLFCKALSSSIVTWALGQPLNVGLAGITAGSAGSGTVLGIVQFFPNVGLVLPSVQAAGFLGIQTPALVQAIVTGLTVGLTGTVYTGTSVGVGAGTDTSLVTVSNPVTLQAILQAQLTAFLGVGVLVPSFAAGLSQGLKIGRAHV